MSDELVVQAAARLDIILRSTPSTASPTSPTAEYPFPHMPSITAVATSGPGTTTNTSSRRERMKSHSRISSIASTTSFMSTISSRILPSMKSTASLASMTPDLRGKQVLRHGPDIPPVPTNQSLAMDSLRRIRAASTRPSEVVNGTWWPSLSTWTLKTSASDQADLDRTPLSARRGSEAPSERSQKIRTTKSTMFPGPVTSIPSKLKHRPSGSLPPTAQKSNPDIRTIASTPNVTSFNLDPKNHHIASGQSTPLHSRRRSPLENSESDSINTLIDPELAAAELRSALTKQVVCGVCGAKGINFPNCRKCEMTFCSRGCRVDEKKGGDGKRSVLVPRSLIS